MLGTQGGSITRRRAKATLLLRNINGLKEKNIPPINVNKYKAIKKHLDKYYSELVNRQDEGDTPYNLRRLCLFR